MASTQDDMIAELQRVNAELRREISERDAALAQRDSDYDERIAHQAATVDVLKAMSASPGDPQPVFDLIVDRARDLCDAYGATVFEFDGTEIHWRAATGVSDDPAVRAAYEAQFPMVPTREWHFGRAILDRQIIRIDDLESQPGLDPTLRGITAKSNVTTPIMRGDAVIGAIGMGSRKFGGFSDSQVELLKTFAEQAAIAITSAKTYRALNDRTAALTARDAENTRLITEQKEALDQQTATAEVLGVINASPGALAPVFEAILDKAHALCGATIGSLFAFDGGLQHAVATHGLPEELAVLIRRGVPINNTVRRITAGGTRSGQIPDIRAMHDPVSEVGRLLLERTDVRTILFVPLRQDADFLGYISAMRPDVRAFSDKEIALLENFAAQAVIAMENARLLTETREALEQQTATAEVLQVINASPGELTPVFNAMLEKAMRLCGAAFGLLSTWDGKNTHRVASRGLPSAYAARRTENETAVDPQSALGQALDTRRPAQTLDLTALDSYKNGHPGIRAIADLAGARTILQVPLVQDQAVTGFFTFYRTEVRAFSDKQVALLKNFAAQAVIAMENARLLGELQERTAELAERNTAFAERIDHQAATIDVLKAMAASPGDPQPVFDLIVRQAREQCDSEIASLFEYDGMIVYCRALTSETWSQEEVEVYARQFPTPLAGGSLAPSSAIQTAIHEQRIVHIRDAHATDERISEGARRLGLQSGVMVPLIRGGRAAGVIVLASKEAGGCSDTQVELLKTFAEQAVIAIASAETYRALQARTADLQESLDYQTATSDVLKAISRSTFDLQPVLDMLVTTAARLCEAENAFLLDRECDTFRAKATFAMSPGDAAILQSLSLKIDRGTISGRVALEGRVVQIADVITDPDYALSETVSVARNRTLLGVPLLRQGVVVGVFALGRQRVQAFTDQQIALVTTFADQAVIAIENTRLLTEQREALERQTAMADVLQIINATSDHLAPVFHAILEAVLRLSGSAFGSLWTFDGDFLHREAVIGYDDTHERFRLNPASRTWRLFHGGDDIDVWPDIRDTDDYRAGNPGTIRFADEYGARTQLIAVLRKDGKPIGDMVIFRKEIKPFTAAEVALVRDFAVQAVIAMENARLLNEQREALERQTATAEVLQVINASPGDLAPVFEAILEKAHRICRFDHGGLALFDGTHFRSVATRGYGEAGDAISRVPYRPSGAQRLVLRGARYGHIPDISAFTADPDDTVFTEFVALTGFRATLLVPLRRDGVVIGHISGWRLEAGPFSDKEVALLESFAAQAVIAMENARLLTEQREALERQTAMAEVLRIINENPGDLVPVFDAILNKAHALCGAAIGSLYTWDGESVMAVATHGFPEDYAAFARQKNQLNFMTRPLFEGERYHHVPDVRALEPTQDIHASTVVEQTDARTILLIPLRKDGAFAGFISVVRTEVRPFVDKEIALLENFAAQAVIAMENARLLGELRDRTAELAERNSAFAERIDHQAATIDVLKAMSSSPGDPQPVFDQIIQRAKVLCNSTSAGLFEYHDGLMHFRGIHSDLDTNLPALSSYIAQFPREPTRESMAARVILDSRMLHIRDMLEEPDLPATTRAMVESGFYRSFLAIPLLRDRRAIGCIWLSAKEAGGYTDSQIALLQTFAEQAVIAITSAETYRALQTRTADLQDSLEYQTAISDVLKAISRSTFDVQPVFNTIVATAARLCDSSYANITTRVDNVFQGAAEIGLRAGEPTMSDRVFLLNRETVTGRVALAKQVVQVADIAADPDYVLTEDARRSGVGTVLGVPLMRGDVVVGTLNLGRRMVRPFTDGQIELVSTFADQAVIAMENARLLTEQREALERQTAMAEVLRTINENPGDLAPVFDAIMERSLRLGGAAFGALYTYDGERFHMAAIKGVPPEFEDYRRQHPQPTGADSPPGQLLATRRPVQVVDNMTHPFFVANPDERDAQIRLGGVRAVLALPLLKDGAVVGQLVIYRKDPGTFPDKQVALLENFAAQAVIAMENARLLRELRDRTAELAERNSAFAERIDHQSATIDVLKAMSASPGDPQPVFDLIVDRAREICDAYGAGVWEFDGSLIHFRAGTGTSDDPDIKRAFEAMYPMVPSRDWHVGRVVLDKRLTRFDDHEAADLNPALRRQTAKSSVMVPLMHDDDVIGVVGLGSREKGGFSDTQIELLKTFAEQAAIAIQSAETWRALQDRTAELAQRNSDFGERIEQQAATIDVLKVMSSTPDDTQPVFDQIVRRARELCNAPSAALFQFDGGLVHYRARALPDGFDESSDEFVSYRDQFPMAPDAGSLTCRAILEKRVIHVRDLETETGLSAHLRNVLRRIGLRSQVTVPLLRDGVALGAITLNALNTNGFSDSQIALLQTFAEQAAIAITSAETWRTLQDRTAALAQRNSEFGERIEQQAATIDVLKVMSSTPDDTQPVFDQIVRRAKELCNGNTASLFELRDGLVHFGAIHSDVDFNTPAMASYVAQYPMTPTRGSVICRTILDSQIIHIKDIEATPGLSPAVRTLIKDGNYRSQVAIPLMRDGQAIGCISLTAVKTGGFSDSQVSLLQTFAEQAVIAITSVATFRALRERTDELVRRQNELRVTFENMGDGVAMFDQTQHLVAWNRKFQDLLDVPDDVIAQRQSFIDYIRYLTERGEYGTDASVEQQVRRLADNVGQSLTLERVRPNGTVIEVRSNPVPGGGFVLIYADITARKQHEEALRAARDAAEAALRDLKAAQADLAHARDVAEEATQAKSMFLANMSHEIRTPMNAIIGLSNLALLNEHDFKQRDYLAKIHTAGVSLLGIINDILDFSKIEAGKLTIEHIAFWIDDVLGNVNTLIGQKASEKHLELVFNVADAVPEGLLGDPLRVSQILTNLISNAVKFTEQGHIQVSIAPIAERNGRVCLQIAVADTGIGMTREQSARLFSAFSQADGSMTRRFGGTGLGLAIVKRLAELMEGDVSVESEAGVGSTFRVTMWLGITARERPRPAMPIAIVGMRALVVDDNPLACEILTRNLRTLRLRADSVLSARAAYGALAQAAADDPYQVVFMDHWMPDIDGAEAARTILAGKTGGPRPRIIMVTGFATEAVREAADAAGASGFLTKPVTLSSLHDMLMQTFADGGAARLVAAGEATPNLTGIRVLLVEDNLVNQQVAEELLTRTGATVTIANNGQQAVAAITGAVQPPPHDIVLMDMQMPVMDGHEATRLIRSDPRYETLPIIAMTAQAMAEERDQCLAEGMNDHIAKPIDPDLLYRTVLAFAGQRVVPRASGASHVPSEPSAAPTGLTEIAGVDTEDGLRRVGGNLRLYRAMLQQYADSQATSPAELRAALAAGDMKTAERLAHTLKGVSATLGIKAASAAAAVVEDRLRHGGLEGIDPHLATMEQTTEAVIAGIRTVLAAASTAVVGSLADARAVIPLLGRLEALLSASDGGALDSVLEAQEVLAKALSAEEVAGLTQAVQNFDFEAALERLRAIIARLGPSDAGVNDESLEDVLGRLGSMLADGDGQALETALAAQASLERAFGVRETDALLREVGNFDFDAALIRVRGLSARAGAAPTGE